MKFWNAVLLVILCYIITLINKSVCEVLFTGKSYLEYRVTKSIFEPDNVNRIHLRFQTIHPSGVLVLMSGRYDSTLVLQLVQGKLRYGIAHRSNDNIEIVIGTNLNDYKWHEVKVLRTGRINEITLDEETKTVLSPLSFQMLSVSHKFYIGGYNRFQMRNIKNVIPNGSKFMGCLDLKQIDSRNPITSYVNGNSKVRALPSGPIVLGCQVSIGGMFGLYTPKSKMVVELRDKENQTAISLIMSVRTFNMDGQIFATEVSNCYTRLGLHNGKVFVELLENVAGSSLAKLESEIPVNDGQWHIISVAVTETDMLLAIDGNKRKTKSLFQVSRKCRSTKKIYFGGFSQYNQNGFVGCLNKITYNHMEIKDHGSLKGFTLKKNTISAGCSISDKCYPNPCRNKGRCFQTWKGYTCQCSGTKHYGRNCEMSVYKTSCAAYQEMGLKETSYCLVDSDGDGDLSAYTTLCKFDEQRQVYSSVPHNKMFEFAATDGDEKLQLYNFHKFKYELNTNSMGALIRESKYCRQKVSFKCYNTALLNAPSGPPNVVWKSRTSELKRYWGGVTNEGEGCACGLNKTCIEPDKLCNCDAKNRKKWAEDSGYLTEKKYLPITRLDVTGVQNGAGFFKIGPLECFGRQKEEENPIAPPINLLKMVCVTIDQKQALVKKANKTIVVDPKENTNKVYPTVVLHTEADHVISTTAHDWSHSSSQKKAVVKLNIETSIRKRQNSDKTLSVLEIVLICAAGLAVVILVVKFVICNIGKLYGQVVLAPDSSKTRCDSVASASCTMTSTLPSDGGTMKKKRNNPLSAYWV